MIPPVLIRNPDLRPRITSLHNAAWNGTLPVASKPRTGREPEVNNGLSEPALIPGRGSAPSSDERTWAMVAHLSAFAGVVLPVLGHVGGPLVVWWLTQREHSAFVERQAREALNFNLTVALAIMLFSALVLIGIGLPLLAALFVVWVVLTFVAALKANEGVDYRYPITLRLLR